MNCLHKYEQFVEYQTMYKQELNKTIHLSEFIIQQFFGIFKNL